MKKIVYTLKLGFTRITFSALVEKGRNCVAMLTGNAAFATPVPALAAITAACDRLALANERYTFTRSRLPRSVRGKVSEVQSSGSRGSNDHADR